jgi:anti-anti-sigma factor
MGIDSRPSWGLVPGAFSVEVLLADYDHVVVTIAGEFDMGTRLDVVDGLAGIDFRHLVIDLGEVTFIDSMGLKLLVELHERCRAKDGTLTLSAASRPVRRVLAATGLDQVLTVPPY